MTKITDWIDGSTLTYGYDAVGNVTSMNDYHGNVTTYTYTASNQLSTITAPGNKVWTYHYNALGQVTSYDHPNGMTTAYAYDNRNRLTKIEHKDGANVLQSFAYDLDAQGNITKTTHEDGSFWDYEYDGRHRLITAVRKNAAATISAVYTYAYDKADNLTQKVSPFEDNFNDGNLDGWTLQGTWSATNGYVGDYVDNGGWRHFYRSMNDPSNEVRVRYRLTAAGNPDRNLVVYMRYQDNSNFVSANVQGGQIRVQERIGGAITVEEIAPVGSDVGKWYTLRVVTDGANIKVYRSADGEMETLILDVSGLTVNTTNQVRFSVQYGGGYDLDDIRVLGDWFWNTTTYAYNAANELTSMTDYNGTTTFSYDDFGRTTSKTDGTNTATYGWRYGSKLASYASTFPGEGAVNYLYGGDGKRRERTTPGGDYTWYNWDIGWNVINEEDQGAGIGNGALNMTYAVTPGGPQGVGQILAAVAGSNPATGSYNYMTHDNIRSTRGVFNQSKALSGEFAFTPYGGAYTSQGDSAFRLFTGKPYDSASGMYFFPYRYYNDHIGRWISRDPLGMVDGPNIYRYVRSNPIASLDALGLLSAKECAFELVGVHGICAIPLLTTILGIITPVLMLRCMIKCGFNIGCAVGCIIATVLAEIAIFIITYPCAEWCAKQMGRYFKCRLKRA